MVGDAVEGDLQVRCGISIYDVISGRIAPRRVLALLRALPDDAATVRLLRAWHDKVANPADEPRWSTAETWSALIYEQLLFLRYEAGARAAEKRSQRPAAPDPLQIPGRSNKKRERTSVYAVARTMANLKQGGDGRGDH